MDNNALYETFLIIIVTLFLIGVGAIIVDCVVIFIRTVKKIVNYFFKPKQ